MGNCFSIPTRGRDNTDRLQLLRVPSEDSEGSFDENKSEPQQLLIISSGQLQSSTERRADEYIFSETRQLAAEAEGLPSSSQVNKNTQNGPQSAFGDKEESSINKVQQLGKEQYPTDMPDSLQGNRFLMETPTRAGYCGNKSPYERGKEFQEEFKKKAVLVRSKIVSKMEFDSPTSLKKPRSIHALFTYEQQNGSKVAGVVDMRNCEKINTTIIDRLLSSRSAVLEMGYDRVYTYLYVKEGAYVSNGVKTRAEMQDIEIVRKDELSPDELAIEIDKKLQSACVSPKVKIDPTDLKNFDYTDDASATGEYMASE